MSSKIQDTITLGEEIDIAVKDNGELSLTSFTVKRIEPDDLTLAYLEAKNGMFTYLRFKDGAWWTTGLASLKNT